MSLYVHGTKPLIKITCPASRSNANQEEMDTLLKLLHDPSQEEEFKRLSSEGFDLLPDNSKCNNDLKREIFQSIPEKDHHRKE